MRRICTLILLTTLSAGALNAQRNVRRMGEILFQVHGDANAADIAADLQRRTGIAFQVKDLAPEWRMYILAFEEKTPNETLPALVKQTGGVRAAQWNYQTYEREKTPDDTEWLRQTNMRFIGLPSVWDQTTGGLTPAGDSIAVAILEKGYQPNHPDLQANLWRNWAERPGNNVDDDGNGYKDDFGGYDVRNQGDSNGNGSSHGTSVNGIIGAKGNNTRGVTGVNWDIKLLNINNTEYESEIIAGYNYAGKMRSLYNQSGGKKGAFIVATNASFGLDNERASEHPLWCAVYDSIGAVGILSVGAPPNNNVDVDIVGDMPTTCRSEYLIAVTNVSNSDIKSPSAGYGPQSVDFGAPGSSIYTTNNPVPSNPGSGYGVFSGTSAAAPHATGTIALMYSLGCEGFAADALSNPAACARRVRDVLFSSLSPNASLNGLTVTGGRLNVAAAAEQVTQNCTGTSGNLAILDVRPNPAGSYIDIVYQTPDQSAYPMRIFDMLGRLVADISIKPDDFQSKIYRLDVENWSKGMYIIALGSGKKLEVKKFLKI